MIDLSRLITAYGKLQLHAWDMIGKQRPLWPLCLISCTGGSPPPVLYVTAIHNCSRTVLQWGHWDTGTLRLRSSVVRMPILELTAGTLP